MENWVDIDGYEEFYEVSDLGNVRSKERSIWCNRGEGYFRTISPRVLKQTCGKRGYLVVGLHKQGQQATKYVHTLVALAFHGVRPPENDVMHIDGVKTNNRADNLRYGTRSENIQQNWDDGKLEACRNPSDETRFKISKSLKGRKLSAEHRSSISAGLKGHKRSPETRVKMSVAQKKRFEQA